MTTLEAVKKAQLQARKDKRSEDAATLTTLIGEAEMLGKNDGNRLSTDTEVIGVIKKFIKNIDETLSIVSKNLEQTARVEALNKEKNLLLTFLPQQLEEAELRVIIADLVAQLPEKNIKMMGKIQVSLKEKFPAQYDGALASKITKELLM